MELLRVQATISQTNVVCDVCSVDQSSGSSREGMRNSLLRSEAW